MMCRSHHDLQTKASTLELLVGKEGLFAEQSVIRRVGREALPLLGGGRAVLMQLTHPLIAAGVADHTNFQSDPLDRLYGTLELMHLLVFGKPQQVKEALQKFHTMHGRVQGRISRETGPYQRHTSYTGDDPDLKMWVLATLVDTSLMSYQRFVAPLSPVERGELYQDSLVLAHALGINEETLPQDLVAFQNYMQSMIASQALTVTDQARDLAWEVLKPDVKGLQFASARLLRFVTAGLLPDRFRDSFGLTWGPRRQVLLDGFSRATRLLRPVAPKWLWQSPQLGGASFLRLLLWPDL